MSESSDGLSTERLRAVIDLEERSFNAWPSQRTIFFNGWIARISEGYTKRANSVSALYPNGAFFDVLAYTRNVYRRHCLPLVFRLTPLCGEEPDAILDRAGFATVDTAIVMTARVGKGVAEIDDEVEIRSFATAEWRRGSGLALGLKQDDASAHDAVLERIEMPKAFALIRRQGVAVGFAVAVLDRAMVGIFDVVVAARYRRLGLARRIVKTLLSWSHSRGGQAAYLQVARKNTTALTLYGSLGFVEAYSYHYRISQNT